VPSGLSNVVAIAASSSSLALQGDGTVVGWNDSGYGQIKAPLAGHKVAISAGTLHGLAVLNNGAPALVPQPAHTYAYSGTTVLLNAGVLGATPLSYQWSLNGTTLAGATAATLTLTNVRPADSGVYSCFASNALGVVTSAGSALTVSNSAPIILAQPANWAAPLGSNAAFSVVAVGCPPLGYQWQLNGKDLAGATQSVLGLTNVAAAGFGNYRVAVSNAFGTTFSASATLTQVRSIVVVWGDNTYGQTNVPPGLRDVVAVATAGQFCMALQADGTVAAWGSDDYGQTDVPAVLTNGVAIAAGFRHCMVLESNGRVVAVGDNEYGQTDVPTDLSNVVAIAAGDYHSLALKRDGTVVVWGLNSYGQANVPEGLSNVVGIAAGVQHSLALRADGTVVGWGGDDGGQIDVPPALDNVVGIAAGVAWSLALRRDGTVVGWGYGPVTDVPADLTNVVAIAANYESGLALRGDGTVTTWGSGFLTNVPAGLTNVVAIAAANANGIAAFKPWGSVAGGNLTLGSPRFLVNRQFQFTITGGATGQSYAVLASTNLLNWMTLTNGSITDSPFSFSDPAATNYPRRYYRLTAP